MKKAIAAIFAVMTPLLASHWAQSQNSSAQAPQTAPWWLSGSHYQTGSRVWLEIRGDLIAAIYDSRPAAIDKSRTIETNDWIFPGLIDAHNHPNYNIYPLWKNARGQFVNRHEWRQAYPPYRLGPKIYMQALSKDKVGDLRCAAARWAELKGLVGGVTLMQGMSGAIEVECTRDFAIHGTKMSDEFARGKSLEQSFEIIAPGQMGQVYIPKIRRHMLENNQSYTTALLGFFNDSGYKRLLEALVSQPKSVAIGLKAALGSCLSIMNVPLDIESKRDAELVAAIEAILPQTTCMVPGHLNAFAQALATWLTKPRTLSGSRASAGYLEAQDTESETRALLMPKEEGLTAVDPILSVSWADRRYIVEFEDDTRTSLLNDLDDESVASFTTHLAEGVAADPVSNNEFDWAGEFGFHHHKLTLIHGLAMSADQLKTAKEKNISLVWSPFSNFLLYGETLDLKTAHELGIDIAMGSDWSMSGSRNMLDEIKIAWDHLRTLRPTTVTTEELVKMATINGAKALGIEQNVGSLAVGQIANILVVKREHYGPTFSPGRSSATNLIDANQSDIQLVVVGGKALYGEVKLVASSSLVQNIEKISWTGCGRLSKKGFFDLKTADGKSFSVRELRDGLRDKVSSFAAMLDAKTADHVQKFELDPLFSCEDPEYETFIKDFVVKTLPEWRANREGLRRQEGLEQNFNALKLQY